MSTYLTGPQLRERLNISASQMASMASRTRDPLPHIRIGQAYRFPVDALAEWEKRNLKGSAA